MDLDSFQSNIYSQLLYHFTPFFKKDGVFSFFNILQKPLKSIYLYGPVGRGKTSLAQLIYDQIQVKKIRYHFDVLFQQIYPQISKGELETIVKNYAHKAQVIWIDDIQINDITTALLIKKIFPIWIKQGRTLILTGNTPPSDFYKGGLHFELFSDFIPFFKENTMCYVLDGEKDYRINNVAYPQGKWFLTKEEISNEFDFASKGDIKELPLLIDNRIWNLSKSSPPNVFLSFYELAEQDRGSADYQELLKMFSCFFIYDIPVLNDENVNAARRFITFIDLLYDKNGSLYAQSAISLEKLFQFSKISLPYKRTFSRLIQMCKE